MNSVEKEINKSLNSIKPSKGVISEAKIYMEKENASKTSKNKIFKYSFTAFSCICIIILLSIFLPTLFKHNAEDSRFIASSEIISENSSSINDYEDQNILKFNFQSYDCEKYILKSTNEILYFKETYSVPSDYNASSLIEIVVLPLYTDKVIQNLEDYMYLNNSYTLGDIIINYEEISNNNFCFAFDSDGYKYYIIVNDTNFLNAKTLLEDLI